MTTIQRKHTRFSLEIPAIIITGNGERQETVLQQISIGGCFTDWDENILTGDEFRMEIPLPNGNRLPLACKAVYRFENTGVGVKFLDISRFEQSLVSKVITEKLATEGLPIHVDPFTQPPPVNAAETASTPGLDARKSRDALLEEIMSGD